MSQEGKRGVYVSVCLSFPVNACGIASRDRGVRCDLSL